MSKVYSKHPTIEDLLRLQRFKLSDIGYKIIMITVLREISGKSDNLSQELEIVKSNIASS